MSRCAMCIEKGRKRQYRGKDVVLCARHWRQVKPEAHWQCICSGQGGGVYSAQCPIHDPSVNTADPSWRKDYDNHLAAQKRVKERLGW